MTASEVQTGRWLPIPGFGAYEACDRGEIRSIDRLVGERYLRGRVLKARVAGTSPYPLVNLTDDQGARQTRTVHSLVLLAFAGPCPEGMESLHFNDIPTDNRWPENLGYGTHPENVVQRMLNRPAAPKPVKVCARCERPFEGNGRRCHDCVVWLGQEGARRLVGGEGLDEVASALDYPSVAGVWRLAVKYGGLELRIKADTPSVMTLAQAAAAGMWPTKSAAARAVQRARLADAGSAGAAKLYRTVDLAALSSQYVTLTDCENVTERDQLDDLERPRERETRHALRGLRPRVSRFLRRRWDSGVAVTPSDMDTKRDA